jgi:ectoine hydroxylase-related dioxygenase (phytanoyl-CoA dioxygenase family)
MIKRYTDAEIAEYAAFYEEHGVVRLPGLVPQEDVNNILATIDEVAKKSDEPREPGEALSFGKAQGRMTIRYMWHKQPVVRKFMLQPALAEPLARILNTKELRFWFDLTFMHDGAPDGGTGAGTGWHHDIAAFPFKGMQLGTIWMAMTPSNAERSRLMFIDRSHKTVKGYYRTSLMTTPGTENDGLLDTPDFDTLIKEGKEKIITWDCEPGDALIIHPYTIHGASGNIGNHGRRVAITTRWMGDDVRFLPTPGALGTTSPGLTPGAFALGSRPEGEYFPLVWPASDATAKTGSPD